MNMRKLLCSLCILSLWGTVFAIEVNQKELQDTENSSVEFINYTGRHSEIDSLQAIAEIGKGLAGAVKSGRAGNADRYAVIHAVDSTDTAGLDADILIIGKNAHVDHINNLRVIIAGYLNRAYGYSEKDAKIIAHFITIYNAVYRSNMEAFKTRYKQVVIKHLTAEKAGLALNYAEWPGKTHIVIPLSDALYQGTISSIDTSSISDKNVINKMREEDDMDIAARKDMIDLKERESDAARERADQAEKDAALAQSEAARKQKEADEAAKHAAQSKNEAAQVQKEAENAKKQAEKSQNTETLAEKTQAAAEKQKEAENAEKNAAEKQKEAEKKQKEADEAAKLAEEKAQHAEKEKQFADAKEKEIQSDRKDVAADTRKIIENEKADKHDADDLRSASVPGAVLKVVDGKNMLSEVVVLDLKTEKALKTSSLNTIRGRVLIEDNNMLIAVADSASGAKIITLVALDAHTLEVVKQAEVPIAEQSMLVQGKDGYYAVIHQNGKYYLGYFNTDLAVRATSLIEVIPYTAIRLTDQGVLVQNTANAIKLLNAADLSEVVK